MKRYVIPALSLLLVLMPGALAHAANLPLLDPDFSIVPEACRAACPCGVGAVLQFIQNIMNVLISFAVVVMSLIIAWAGFLFVMSAANPESRSKARGMLINAFIGLFIVLSAWLIVDFIMKHLYGDGSTAFGPWNKILVLDGSQCIEKVDVSQIKGLPGVVDIGINGVAIGSGSNGTESSTGAIPTGPITSRICTAAGQYSGHSTTACNCGTRACAWAVNEVLKIASVPNIGGSSVIAMNSALQSGRGQEETRGQTQCGDIVLVIAGGRNHVGICQNTGCSSAISNSSTDHSFSWVSSGVIFHESYAASYTRHYYRVLK